MASEKDFLQDLGITNQFGISSVTERVQQTNLLGTYGPQITNGMDIGSMISDEARNYLKNLKEEDLLAEIVFPDDIPADLAALFLNMIGATIATPSNDYRFANEDFNNGYMLVANKKTAEDFIKKYDNAEDLSKDPVMAGFCAALSKAKDKIQINPWIKEKTAEYLVLLDEAHKFNKHVFDCCYDMRDKINFACSLCSDNFRISELSDAERKKEEICKHFILQNIRQIETASTLIEQELLLDRIIHNLITETSILQRKHNEMFRTTLGKLKMSNPLSMAVLLDNGEHVDFFGLDKTKSYRLMNHINISKAREFIDFSHCDINGHFTCSRIKVPIALPRSVNYGLDCSYCCDNFINENTVFPKGVQIIDFTGTIKNFTDLAKLNLPETVTTIALTNSILNAALKKPEVLAEFRVFEQKYPNIKIVGDKPDKTLQNLLEQAQAGPKTKKAETIKPQNADSVKPVIPEKTAEWLTRKEILGLCQNEPFANIDGLDRFIKRAINSNINIKSEDKMVDGNVVSCVHIDCLPTLKEIISHVIEESFKHTKIKPTQTVVITERNQEKKGKVKKQKPVRFRKYIPKQVWKEICTSCNDSNGLLYSILQRINLINLDYTKQVLSGAIQYIDENGQIQVVPTLQKKRGCALAQNIEDRTKGAVSRRIVWTMNPKDKIIVAIKFCADHTDNTNAIQTYKNARTHAAKCNNMNGESVTRELINQNIDNYYDVVDLLQQYKPKEKPAVNVQTKTEKPKTQSNVRVPDKPANSVSNTKKAPKASLVDMTSLEYKIRAMIETLAGDIEKKNYRFTKLKNTDAKLKVWEEIKVCLDRQKRLEQELQEMIK